MTTEETLRKIDATLRKNPLQETLLYLRDTGLYQGREKTRVLAVGGASIVKDKIDNPKLKYIGPNNNKQYELFVSDHFGVLSKFKILE